ncbi:MAG: hypothetical protein J6575_03650 [Bifidobacterium sp.]|nr:hypothetical protein [Bifidobacterium sp.]
MSVRIIPDTELDGFTANDPVCDVSCDAVGCTGHIRLMDEDFDGLEFDHCTAGGYSDADINAALDNQGWGIGSRGVQRGHVYCPLHAHMGVES